MNKQIYSGVLTVLLLPAFAAFAEEDVVTKSFSAKAGDNLYVKVDRGSIRVLTGDSDKVEIQVVREARRVSAERAGELFEQHKIEFSQEGDTVRTVLRRLSRGFPDLHQTLWDARTGELGEHIEVLVNDAVLGVNHELDSPVHDGDTFALIGQYLGG